MDPFTRKTFQYKGKNILYLETATAKEKTPIIMIAGWPVSSVTLEPLAQTLTSDFKCFLVDLPGFGGSELPGDFHATFQQNCEFIHAFQTDVAQFTKVNLFGYSTGGVVAINYSAKHPDKVNKQVLFSPPYNGIGQLKSDITKRPLVSLFYRLFESFPQILNLINLPLIKEWMFNFIFNRYYYEKYPKLFSLDKNYLRRLIREASKVYPIAGWEMAHDLATHDFTSEAKSIKVPTLIMSPGNDEAVSPKWSRELAVNVIPKAEFFEIWNEDHASAITEAKAISRQILKFYKK